jgi:rubrerythrin
MLNIFFFRNYPIKTKLHMRYLYQVAILVEEEGIKFYSELAKKANDTAIKRLCIKLAGDEKKHKEIFEAVLAQWLPEPADEQTLNSLIQELRNAGLFSEPPSLNASEKDMIKYAIEQEIKTAEFYQSFEEYFPQTWKKLRIQRLVLAEKEHAESLRSLLTSKE